jgi:hypothetical protein
MSHFFLVVSSVLVLISVCFYFRQVQVGTSTPNLTSWLISVVVSTMNAVSFFFVTQQNLWQSMYVMLVPAGLIVTFLYAIFYGKFVKMVVFERIILCSAVVIGVVWKVTNNVTIANLSLQLILFLSIIPTIIGLLQKRLKEKGLPWYIGVGAHMFATIGILISPTFEWYALAYPVITGIAGNGAVAVIVFSQSQKRPVG